MLLLLQGSITTLSITACAKYLGRTSSYNFLKSYQKPTSHKPSMISLGTIKMSAQPATASSGGTGHNGKNTSTGWSWIPSTWFLLSMAKKQYGTEFTRNSTWHKKISMGILLDRRFCLGKRKCFLRFVVAGTHCTGKTCLQLQNKCK